jgi:hypothetical protein
MIKMSDLDETLNTLKKINPKKVREMSSDNNEAKELQRKVIYNLKDETQNRTDKNIDDISSRLKDHEKDAKNINNTFRADIEKLKSENNELRILVNKHNMFTKIFIAIVIALSLASMFHWSLICKLENRVLRLEDTYKYHMVVDEGKKLEDLPIK